jgi:hypothetical protein
LNILFFLFNIYKLNVDIVLLPPALQINLANSGPYLAISLIHVAANFLTNRSLSFNLYKILGKTSASTTISANSTACLAMLAKHEHTCLLS